MALLAAPIVTAAVLVAVAAVAAVVFAMGGIDEDADKDDDEDGKAVEDEGGKGALLVVAEDEVETAPAAPAAAPARDCGIECGNMARCSSVRAGGPISNWLYAKYLLLAYGTYEDADTDEDGPEVDSAAAATAELRPNRGCCLKGDDGDSLCGAA